MLRCAVNGVEESVLNPEVDEPQHEPVGHSFQRRGPEVIRHACAMAEEVRQPSRLDDPDEGDIKNAAGHRDCHVRACDYGGGFEFALDRRFRY